MADQKVTTGIRPGSGSSHGFEKAAEKATTASEKRYRSSPFGEPGDQG